MRVLVIEDEAPAYRRLMKLISEYDNSIEIVGVIQSVKSGIDWFLHNAPPDIILSDIQLADDLSFKIFTDLNIQTPVIFTTAYDEYAINAFKFHSIDYLLKPIKPEELKQSFDKFKLIHQKKDFVDYEKILKSISVKEYRNRFLVYSGDTLIPLNCENVAYVLSEDGATIIVTVNGKRYFFNDSLDQLEKDLDPKDFFRANRQLIISAKAVQKVYNYGNQKLKLSIIPQTNFDIIISKLKATAFKEWLGN